MSDEVNPLATILEVAEIIPHPNADRLDLVSPYGDGLSYAVVARGTMKVGDKVLWFDAVNEAMVPVSIPEFSFLQKDAKNGYARVKAKRLRGVVSRGLMVPARQEWIDAFSSQGAAVFNELLELKKYEVLDSRGRHPGSSFDAGSAASGPDSALCTTKYDVDSIVKNVRMIPVGAEVVCTEKIHGANFGAGWASYNGEMKFHVRSRNMWKLKQETREKTLEDGSTIQYEVGGGMWWDVAIKYNLSEKLQSRPGYFIYGEVYGQVQDLKYGLTTTEFIAFDCWDSNTCRWLSWNELVELCNELDIPHVPVVASMKWEPEVSSFITESGETRMNYKLSKEVISLSDGPTLLNNAGHTREGIVIRYDRPPGDPFERVILKLVGNDYLTR
jgi:RNA ligase (TIGR02306 family)